MALGAVLFPGALVVFALTRYLRPLSISIGKLTFWASKDKVAQKSGLTQIDRNWGWGQTLTIGTSKRSYCMGWRLCEQGDWTDSALWSDNGGR